MLDGLNSSLSLTGLVMDSFDFRLNCFAFPRVLVAMLEIEVANDSTREKLAVHENYFSDENYNNEYLIEVA